MLTNSLVYFLVAAMLVVAITVVVGNRRIYGPIISKGARIPKLSGVADKAIRLLDAAHALLHPASFLVGMGLAIIAWSCEGLAFHLLMDGFGSKQQILTSCTIYGTATLANAMSALPGDIGGFELIMVLLLSQLGMPAAETTIPVVVFRLCMLWLGSLIGLVFMLGWLFWMGQGCTDSVTLNNSLSGDAK